MQKVLEVNVEMLTEHKSVLDRLGRSQEVLALFNNVGAPLLREVSIIFKASTFSYQVSSCTLLLQQHFFA